MVKYHSRFVAMSRCSILISVGLTCGSALRSLMFPRGNGLLVIENEFLEGTLKSVSVKSLQKKARYSADLFNLK